MLSFFSKYFVEGNGHGFPSICQEGLRKCKESVRIDSLQTVSWTW